MGYYLHDDHIYIVVMHLFREEEGRFIRTAWAAENIKLSKLIPTNQWNDPEASFIFVYLSFDLVLFHFFVV